MVPRETPRRPPTRRALEVLSDRELVGVVFSGGPRAYRDAGATAAPLSDRLEAERILRERGRPIPAELRHPPDPRGALAETFTEDQRLDYELAMADWKAARAAYLRELAG